MPTAVGGIKIPVGRPNVVPRRKAQGACGAVDPAGRPLDLKERAHGSLVELEVNARLPDQPKAGAELLVAKAGLQSDRTEGGQPVRGGVDPEFRFELNLVAGIHPRVGWGFPGKPSPAQAPRNQTRSGRGIDPDSEQAAAAADASVRGVEEGVALADPAQAKGMKALELGDNCCHVINAKLYLSFAMRADSHCRSIARPSRAVSALPGRAWSPWRDAEWERVRRFGNGREVASAERSCASGSEPA